MHYIKNFVVHGDSRYRCQLQSFAKSMYRMPMNAYSVCAWIISPEVDIESTQTFTQNFLFRAYSVHTKPKTTKQNQRFETKPSKTHETTKTNKRK